MFRPFFIAHTRYYVTLIAEGLGKRVSVGMSRAACVVWWQRLFAGQAMAHNAAGV